MPPGQGLELPFPGCCGDAASHFINGEGTVFFLFLLLRDLESAGSQPRLPLLLLLWSVGRESVKHGRERGKSRDVSLLEGTVPIPTGWGG